MTSIKSAILKPCKCLFLYGNVLIQQDHFPKILEIGVMFKQLTKWVDCEIAVMIVALSQVKLFSNLLVSWKKLSFDVYTVIKLIMKWSFELKRSGLRKDSIFSHAESA